MKLIWNKAVRYPTSRAGTTPVPPVVPVLSVKTKQQAPPDLVAEVEFDEAASNLPRNNGRKLNTSKQLLYYEPDGKGGISLVYPDKPPGRSWKL